MPNDPLNLVEWQFRPSSPHCPALMMISRLVCLFFSCFHPEQGLAPSHLLLTTTAWPLDRPCTPRPPDVDCFGSGDAKDASKGSGMLQETGGLTVRSKAARPPVPAACLQRQWHHHHHHHPWIPSDNLAITEMPCDRCGVKTFQEDGLNPPDPAVPRVGAHSNWAHYCIVSGP